MAAEGQCCLKSCGHADRAVTSEKNRASVRAFQVADSERDRMFATWDTDGKATFHLDCWQRLTEAASREMDTDLTLSSREADLVKEASKTAEYHYANSTVAEEGHRIAHILKTSKYCIAFTGAGISTAAGIGDFRGLDGKWTNREKEKKYGCSARAASNEAIPTKKRLPRHLYRPTYTHEALVKLVEMGLLKFIISQNTDGLHRLSGVPQERLSELHGNSFQEKCETCGKRYDRMPGSLQMKATVPPRICPRCHINHRTGGMCTQPGCGGYLMNTIINFGDFLEPEVLDVAHEHARKNDSVLCLGSTLQVSPANTLVTEGPPPARLIICNRQRTPYDDLANERGENGERLGSRVFGDCDLLMQHVMKNILPKEELKKWEGDREVRMVGYNLSRQVTKK